MMKTRVSKICRSTNRRYLVILCCVAALCVTQGGFAQDAQLAVPVEASSVRETESATSAADTDSVFPHFKEGRFWVSGQANFIFQTHPSFYARYTGTNSLLPKYEKATSRVMTLYTGVQLDNSTEMLVHFEEAGGSGLSQALGLAGFTNLDVVRNPTLSKAPYLARLMVHKVFALSKDRIEGSRGPMSLITDLPSRRLEIRAGKFDTVDFFDLNTVGSDSHLQFMNWSTAQNGAYDFSADTRGYTWGVLAEYQDRNWAFRLSESLMPKVANGIDLVWNLHKAHSENFEYELRKGFVPHKAGVIRLLTFVNHANMGIYREAVSRYEAGFYPVPDITNHPWRTTAKYGFGINVEQSLTSTVKAFARWGWNNGKTESFAYTEIDSTVAFGAGFDGRMWRRRKDRAGIAFASNAISRDHQSYLAHGGLGFIIGDGALRYGRESILESYYTAHVWRGVYAGPGLQYVVNPAYNKDRGPVIVPVVRLHLEL